MSKKTNTEFLEQMDICRKVFTNKNKDYGTSWRILRIPTFIDQIYIKAQRIRSIEEAGEQKISDDVKSEYVGIINYCVLTLIQINLDPAEPEHLPFNKVLELYNTELQKAMDLMLKKNHDYGEAWRNMYITSYTDLILTKILRVRSILENKGKTIASEGIDANLYDMINYSFFALIKLSYTK